MVPLTIFPEENVLAKIFMRGKSLPIKLKANMVNPPWDVYIGFDFMPDSSRFTHHCTREHSIYLRDSIGTLRSDGYIGFSFVARQFINTMVGCAFSSKSAVDPIPTGIRHRLDSEDSEVPRLTYRDFKDIKLEMSERRFE